MNIVVLLSAGRDPHSGQPRPVGVELQAIALARSLPGAIVTGLHAGMADAAVRDAFGHGLSDITILTLDPGDDPLPALIAELRHIGPALILAGRRGQGGTDSGLLPYRIAHACSWPIVADATAITCDGGTCHVIQSLPRGARRRITVSLPAMITIHEAAPPALPFTYRGRKAGRLHEHAGMAGPPPDPAGEIRPYRPRPKLIGEIAPAGTGVVLSSPTPDDAAAAVLAYIERFRTLS
ncbi:electron transfer flavoprotein subunit beta [Acidiphilium acidophilum]|uniref:electron transfer flavoprotein subunit beta n=1 Tax=Acidiphilium acidophilum TaxID=76588 RepID=UPI002E8E6DC6|nr:electron transfer flavoprotein subunit beta [Acidiphilium acidophilum]